MGINTESILNHPSSAVVTFKKIQTWIIIRTRPSNYFYSLDVTFVHENIVDGNLPDLTILPGMQKTNTLFKTFFSMQDA